MNTPKWIIAHFSPTGGTKRVADAIAAGFSVPVAQMDLTKADSAVTLNDPSHTDNERCINCMRCVASCPMNSRALPDAFRAMITKMLGENAAGYKKPVVFL